MERVRERKEAHRQRGRLYRTAVATAGVLIVLIGLALVPLPGPGWLIVAVGLAVLALEFDRAERLLERIVERLETVTEQAAHASPLQKALGAMAIVAGGAALVGAAVLWDIPFFPG